MKIVCNNKIFMDNIANYSSTSHRRVDLTAKIANGVDVVDAPPPVRRLQALQIRCHPPEPVGVREFSARRNINPAG